MTAIGIRKKRIRKEKRKKKKEKRKEKKKRKAYVRKKWKKKYELIFEYRWKTEGLWSLPGNPATPAYKNGWSVVVREVLSDEAVSFYPIYVIYIFIVILCYYLVSISIFMIKDRFQRWLMKVVMIHSYRAQILRRQSLIPYAEWIKTMALRRHTIVSLKVGINKFLFTLRQRY